MGRGLSVFSGPGEEVRPKKNNVWGGRGSQGAWYKEEEHKASALVFHGSPLFTQKGPSCCLPTVHCTQVQRHVGTLRSTRPNPGYLEYPYTGDCDYPPILTVRVARLSPGSLRLPGPLAMPLLCNLRIRKGTMRVTNGTRRALKGSVRVLEYSY